MKKRALFYGGIFFLFFIYCKVSVAQNKKWDGCLQTIDDQEIFSEKNIMIFVLSDPRCGHCHFALKSIGEQYHKDNSIDIIALDISGKPEKVEALELYIKYSINVIDATVCDKKLSAFIPRLLVYNRKNDEMAFTMNGWGKKSLRKMKRKISKLKRQII